MAASRRAEPIKDDRGNLSGYSYGGHTIARDADGRYTVEHDGRAQHFRLLRDALAYVDEIRVEKDGDDR
jgi:hypothetical protein